VAEIAVNGREILILQIAPIRIEASGPAQVRVTPFGSWTSFRRTR
jgi:hypothetical protein